MINYILIIIIAAIFSWALYKTIKKFKSGSCCSGGGDCPNCNRCK